MEHIGTDEIHTHNLYEAHNDAFAVSIWPSFSMLWDTECILPTGFLNRQMKNVAQ